MRVGLIGVPFNSNGLAGGVALAPSALRHRGLVGALERVADIHDFGDVRIGPASPTREPKTAVIAPGRAADMSRAVAVAVNEALKEERLPLVIGGDCAILFGCLMAAQATAPDVGLIFVDGHEDAYPRRSSATGELADMELGLLLGRDRDGLPPSLAAAIPIVAAARVAILGARDSAEAMAYGVSSLREEVAFFADDAMLTADPRRIMAAAHDQLASEGRRWLHVDLDVLSTSALPEVDYRQPGGISWRTLETACAVALERSPEPVGWDVTIYNPEIDPTSAGADRIVAALVKIFETAARQDRAATT